MPKMKSNRAAKKRFKVSGTGKIIRSKAYASHMFTAKPQKRKRRLRKPGLVSVSEVKRIKTLILG